MESSPPQTTLAIPIPQFLINVFFSIVPTAYSEWWLNLLHENPTHLYIETTLIFVIIYIVFKSPQTNNNRNKRPKPIDEHVLKERLQHFHPEPLAPKVLSEEAQYILQDMLYVDSPPNRTHVMRHGKSMVSFASTDFLDLGSSDEILAATQNALNKYGVGSCGPRGFYGTIDVHVFLEEALAKFFSRPDAIIYSDAASAVSSAIPAFANRSDLLLVDDACNESILVGCKLSRAKLVYYKHNDMMDLEEKMMQIQSEDKRLQRKPGHQRRWVVFEGLFRNTGQVVKLDALYQLKMKYQYRLFADECLSFGVLGPHGRGLLDHFASKGVPDDALEILIGSLETSLASVGGFCVGTQEVVEHQRLNGAGYCFSASAPPFTASAAQACLEVLDSSRGVQLLKELNYKSQRLSDALGTQAKWTVLNKEYAGSPVIHVRLTEEMDHLKEVRELRRIAKNLEEKDGILVVQTHFPAPHRNSLRMFVHCQHTEEELDRVAAALLREVKNDA